MQAETKAKDNERAAIEQGRAADAARVQAAAETVVAQQALSKAEVNLYFNNINLADREWPLSNFTTTDRLLDETSPFLRNWEWNYLKRLNQPEEDAVLHGHGDSILAMVMNPDGKRLRTFSADKTYKDWDWEPGKRLRLESLVHQILTKSSIWF